MLFNTALDADNTPSLKTNTLKKVYSIMDDHDLCDMFRIRNPDRQRYTWRQKLHLSSIVLTAFLFQMNYRKMWNILIFYLQLLVTILWFI